MSVLTSVSSVTSNNPLYGMRMTLLQIVQQVCNELALNSPATVAANIDPQIKQMYSLLNRLGKDLIRQYNWQLLDKEYILNTVATSVAITTTQGSATVTMASTTGITTNWGVMALGVQPFAQVVSVDSTTQVTLNMACTATGTVNANFAQVQYPLPSDWGNAIGTTMWDRTNRWPVDGAKSSQEWQSFKSGIVYAGPRLRFRIQGNTITLNPPPANGHALAFEYISNGFVYDVNGNVKTSFTADTDSSIFDDSLLVAGLKVKFKQAKGLDVGFELSEFTELLNICKSQDQSAPKLSMSPQTGSVLLSTANVQDGSWFTY